MAVQSLSRSSFLTPRKYNSLLVGNEAFNPSSDFLIQEQVLTSTTASVTFDVSTLAAQGYKHLQVRLAARSTVSGSAVDNVAIRMNGDTGSNYVSHVLYGNGGAVASAAFTSATYMYLASSFTGSTAVSGNFGAGVVDILDFNSTTKNTTIRSLAGFIDTSDRRIALLSGAWLNTAAMTSITFSNSNQFAAGSRFSLYGSLG